MTEFGRKPRVSAGGEPSPADCPAFGGSLSGEEERDIIGFESRWPFGTVAEAGGTG
ncbi:hypothetical protein [Telmatospirillum sp.]|uniref:hypothetical protein n=1 Tax=Telmatospirillum sp. TaxID=2079197 RepID=UPI002849E286|nr:hypothetical protein [Telmatospirillum sp.]MDR3438524.1 hypothetical protein [Telmatospirillum sp.]